MHTRNPFLDQFAKLSVAAMGVAQAAGEEARSAARAGADKLVAEMDLVRRDEYEVLRDEVAALRAELERLKAERAG
jgi:BMFP domain-containing protein YqiC